MTTRERGAGKRGFGPSLKAGDYWHFAANLILISDTVLCFSGRFVMIQANVKFIKPL
jgi:hypothetical protein